MRVFAVLAALLLPVAANAFELKRDPTGAPIHFASREVVFHLPARLPDGVSASDLEESLRRALDSWAEVSGLTFKLRPGLADARPGFRANGADRNDVLFAFDHWDYEPNAVATTLLSVDPDTHEIVDADIVLNAVDHRFRVLDATSRPGGVYDDLQNALSHELGHALGLAHTPVADAAMFGGSLRGEVSKRTLSADDIDGVRALYLAANASAEPATGCSTSGGAPLPLALVLLLLGAGYFGRVTTRFASSSLRCSMSEPSALSTASKRPSVVPSRS